MMTRFSLSLSLSELEILRSSLLREINDLESSKVRAKDEPAYFKMLDSRYETLRALRAKLTKAQKTSR
jgi:hypothetical protein